MREMESLLNQYTTKLRIVAKIPTGDKLNTVNNDLDLYKPGLSNFISRMYNGDGRARTVFYLKQLYREVGVFSSQLISLCKNEQDRIEQDRTR